MRPFRRTITISGNGVSRVAAEVLPGAATGTVTQVIVRNSSGSPTATVYLLDNNNSGAPADEEKVYESASTVFTASATVADVKDGFWSNQTNFPTGLWCQINATAAAGAWSCEVDVQGFVYNA